MVGIWIWIWMCVLERLAGSCAVRIVRCHHGRLDGAGQTEEGVLVPHERHDDLPLLLKIRTLVNCVRGCCARVQTSATTHPYQI